MNEDQKRLEMLEIMLEDLKQGVIVCDKRGKVILYNRAYSEVDRMPQHMVVGQMIEKSYQMRGEGSSLRKVMQTKQPIMVHRQKYVTCNGYEVDVLKDTYPILHGDTVLGAFAMMRDFVQAKAWANDIIAEIMRESAHAQQDIPLKFDEIDFKNPKMIRNMEKLDRTIHRFFNTSIFGAVGSEGEFIAKYIAHENRNTATPFVIDCAAIAPESQDFVFFGNDDDRESGLLDKVRRNFLIIKHIDYLEMRTQMKLKDDIERKKIKIITIFDKTPNDIFAEGKLHLELFYLLNEIQLHIPPLCDRTEDLTAYIVYLLRALREPHQREIKLSLGAYRQLSTYAWPGDFLELFHTMKSAVRSCKDHTITVADLPDYIAATITAPTTQQAQAFHSHLSDALAETERMMVKTALERNHGNVTLAATDLGISRQNLQYRIRKLNI